MVRRWYYKIPEKFPGVNCVEEIMMPDHIHVILRLPGGHAGPPLHDIISWFKTMTTNDYVKGVKNLGWPKFEGKLWQRNYFEHIIRNEEDFINTVNYIRNNPIAKNKT